MGRFVVGRLIEGRTPPWPAVGVRPRTPLCDAAPGRDVTCGRWPCTAAVVFRRGVRIVLTGARDTPGLAACWPGRCVLERAVTTPRVGLLARTAG